MSFAVDTNILLRSIDDGHAAQPVVNDGLLALRSQGEILSIFPQNLIEFWAVATRPVVNNGLGWSVDPAKVELENLKYLFVVLADTDIIFTEWERLVVHHRVAGKQAHDARLVAAMLVHGVTHLLTFNTNDFKRFSEIMVVDPQNVLGNPIMRRFILLLCLILIVPTTYAAKIKTTEDLVTAMQKKYGKSWYKTATFAQKTVDYDKDGKQKVSTWYEALSVPGSLRIDFTPVKDGNGILFTERKLFSFKDGKQESSREFVHPLMILGFDIYKLPFADVMATLKALKFDLAILHEDTWQGRPVYVVGAKQGDLHSQQFWIDRKNLYFVRMLGPAGKDGTQAQETEFNKYQRLGGGWMAPEVVFKIDGRIRTTEQYSEMRANPPLDSRLFDPQYWNSVHWRE